MVGEVDAGVKIRREPQSLTWWVGGGGSARKDCEHKRAEPAGNTNYSCHHSVQQDLMVFAGGGECSKDGIGQWQIPPMWTNSSHGDPGREPGATKRLQ